MYVAPYLIGRDIDGRPATILVVGILKEELMGFPLHSEIGSRIEGDVWGVSLFLSFSVPENGSEVIEIVLPDIPSDLQEAFVSGTEVIIEDSDTGNRLNVIMSSVCRDGHARSETIDFSMAKSIAS